MPASSIQPWELAVVKIYPFEGLLFMPDEKPMNIP
jgi:hypothetical protein